MNDYDRIARVISYLDENHIEQPTLAQLAERADLSQHHFHRLFSRWAGVTPKGFLQCLTLSRAKEALEAGESVLDAAFNTGLSGPGRLHDLCVNLEAASPGEVKSGGEGWTIRAGFGESPFGTCLIGVSPRGICHLSFVESKNRHTGAVAIEKDWPLARIDWDDDPAGVVDSIFAKPTDSNDRSPLKVFVRGTEFQVRVWRALLQIPRGSLTSYGRIAESLGDRGAAWAVGSAVGRNRMAYLIPCHRVIRETGIFGDYRWGKTRKKALVAWESPSQS
ncbi:MAG: methylated-DNA--[protein]-cysteine S-methyltransferase [Pirellulaceae bacterium]|jgi:AraC family transcriptional regulator of adaptative response/methylated-DNA-[protein]-cysteine methyltransferase|nr:methylated-DNA--[protein]-cysteine S-methyltransferase [Pirellulaceae bacterium]